MAYLRGLGGLCVVVVGVGAAFACGNYVPPDVANYGPPNGLKDTPDPPPGDDSGSTGTSPPAVEDAGAPGEGGAPAAAAVACVKAGGTLVASTNCAVSWKTTIYPKMEASGAWGCAAAGSCHGAAGGPQPVLTGTTEESFYTTLANYTAINNLPYFNPCSTNPAQSTFVCNTSTTTCQAQMPLVGSIADPSDIATWVACGAPEN